MKIYYSDTQLVIRHYNGVKRNTVGKAFKRSDPEHKDKMLAFIDSPIVTDRYCISMPRGLFDYAVGITHPLLKYISFELCCFS